MSATHARRTGARRLARPATILIAAAALTAAGTITAAAGPPRAAAADKPAHSQVLHFGVLFSPQNLIDVPPLQTHDGDFRAGDYTVFSDVLTDRAGKPVGTEGGTGMITQVSDTGAQLNYDLSIQLPGGQIAAQGLSSPDPHKHLAVVGGTGRYVGAGGEFDLIENGDGTGSLTLTLR
jgi:Allene oxide cyclase barrel like domain